jgi:hypothetical protein
MNNKHSKTFIKHYNNLTLKGFVNKFQNFWKLHIFWNILHKPWHNNILKIILKFIFVILKKSSKNIPFKGISKVGECNLCYPICMLVWTMKIYN